MLKQLALIELTLGAFVSLAASGRLSVRLTVDGAISLAFIPALEVAAFWVVRRVTARPVGARFSADLGRFLVGNRPWLVWLALSGGVLAVVPPRALSIAIVQVIEVSAVVPAIWSLRTDAAFFGEGTSRRRNYRRALMVRAIAWPLGVAYFLGIAIWSLVEPRLSAWL
jgi:hypothetical protein